MNDTVVFCAACQSVFLMESWEYMDGKHCHQFETLTSIPQPPSTFFAKKKKKFNFEFFEDSSTEKLQVVLTTILGTGLMLGFSKLFHSNYFYIYTTCALILSILGGLLAKTKSFREAFVTNNKTIKITEDGIELKGEDFYFFHEIDKLEYVKTLGAVYRHEDNFMNATRIIPTNSLYIVRKNKLTIQHKLPKKSYLETEKFLLALARSSHLVKVNFHSEYKKEQELLKRIENEYKEKILILQTPTNYLF